MNSYKLTPGDKEIFKRAADPSDGIGVNWFTQYYFQREMMQWQWFMHHAPQPDITVIGGTGSGKAQPLSAMVLTPTGFVPMGSLSVGDSVIAGDGCATHVTGVFSQGEQDVYEITFDDGAKTRCTLDHLWVVWLSNGYKKDTNRRDQKGFQVLSTCQILENWNKRFVNIPLVGRIDIKQEHDLPIDPYLLGLILGDGGISAKDSVKFSSADSEIIEAFSSLLPDTVEIVKSYGENCDYHIKNKVRPNQHTRNEFLHTLIALGLQGKKSDDKFIPKQYFNASFNDRLSLLQGLLDTDGNASVSLCKDGRVGGAVSVEYTTISKQLMGDVVFLVRSLGGMAKVVERRTRYTHNGEKRTGQLSYRIAIRLPDTVAPFRLQRKQSAMKERKQFLLRKMVSVKLVGKELAQCISVSHPAQTYVTDDFIVTHNTVGAGLSYATYAATTPRFGFMNMAPTAWQSKLMFDAIVREADGKPFERFIYKVVERPYPKITLRSDYIGESTMHFMSAADDATKIQGWEGDAMNLDEAGLIVNGDQLIGMMATRLRGTVPMPGGGIRERVSRLSMITASYLEAPPWLWNRMDAMIRDPQNFLSLTVKSAEAGTLTARDLENYRRRIPIEQQAQLMEGARPEGTGDHFKLHTVTGCEDWSLNRFMQYHLLEKEVPTPGWAYEEVPGAGCVHFEMPPDNGRQYLLVGDPGQGNPPLRNAGAIWVLDITDFPKEPAVLRYFQWVYGRGSYDGFKTAYKYCWDTYRPVAAVVDSTGTQSLWNEQVLIELGIWADGMDFNGKKPGMLVSAMQMIQRHLIKFPFIQGLRSQLVNYKLAEDNKLAQDLVVLLLMSAYYLRQYLWEDFSEKTEETSIMDSSFTPARSTREAIRSTRSKIIA